MCACVCAFVCAYPLCCVDQVKESQQGDGDPYSWPIHYGNQRLWEVDVGFDILPDSAKKKLGGHQLGRINEKKDSILGVFPK